MTGNVRLRALLLSAIPIAVVAAPSQTPGAAEPPVDAIVGWYGMPEGDSALATFSARGGIQIFSLWDTLYVARLAPDSMGTWRWGGPGGPAVGFERDAGRVAAFGWRDELGRPRRAVRLPDSAYTAEEVEVVRDGVRLSGTLFTPLGFGAVTAAAVMIHGSGYSDRDNYWYMTIADALVRSGVAVLLPDKRGSGKSGGDWSTTDLEGFAADVRAQVELLRTHPAIDEERIGLVGISQGGHVAPLVAAREPVRFVVNISGSAVPLEEQLVHELTQDMKRDRLPGFLDRVVLPISVWVVKRRRPQWWRVNGPIDPIEHWREVDAPSLVIYGEEDEIDNVPVARSVERLRSLARDGLDIWVFPGTGHGLFEAGDSRRIRADVLSRLAEWVATTAAASTPRNTAPVDPPIPSDRNR